MDWADDTLAKLKAVKDLPDSEFCDFLSSALLNCLDANYQKPHLKTVILAIITRIYHLKLDDHLPRLLEFQAFYGSLDIYFHHPHVVRQVPGIIKIAQEQLRIIQKKQEKSVDTSLQDLELLQDIVNVLNTIFGVLPEFINPPETLPMLVSIYNLLVYHSPSSDWGLRANDYDLEPHDLAGISIRKLKRDMIKLTFGLLKQCYFDNPKAIDEFITLMFALLDLCPQSTSDFLFDSSLLLDLEIEMRISKFVQVTQNTLESSSDHHVQLDYIVQSLVNLVNFSGNSGISSFVQSHQNSEKLAESNDGQEDKVTDTSISFIREMFPDMEQGFIIRCLKALNMNTDLLTSKILENDYTFLKESESTLNESRSDSTLDQLEFQKSEILDSRRNVFDGDEFDVFRSNQINHANIFIPNSAPAKTEGIDNSLKAKIMQYYERDIYEDERDDTYDSADINIVVGNQEDENDSNQPTFDKAERLLVNTFLSTPEVLHKSQRKTSKRQMLCEATGMSHEQIEGWYIMLLRNPFKQKLLEKYEFEGNKRTVLDNSVLPANGENESIPGKSENKNTLLPANGENKSALRKSENKSSSLPGRGENKNVSAKTENKRKTHKGRNRNKAPKGSID